MGNDSALNNRSPYQLMRHFRKILRHMLDEEHAWRRSGTRYSVTALVRDLRQQYAECDPERLKRLYMFKRRAKSSKFVMESDDSSEDEEDGEYEARVPADARLQLVPCPPPAAEAEDITNSLQEDAVAGSAASAASATSDQHTSDATDDEAPVNTAPFQMPPTPPKEIPHDVSTDPSTSDRTNTTMQPPRKESREERRERKRQRQLEKSERKRLRALEKEKKRERRQFKRLKTGLSKQLQ